MLTKGAIGNLVNRYKAVLKKCNLINTFGSLAVASMLVLGGAGGASANVVIEAGSDNTYSLDWDISGNNAPTSSLEVKGTDSARVTFHDFQGLSDGSVFYIGDMISADIKYSDFAGNKADYRGGALFFGAGVKINRNIDNSTFKNNQADAGGAIYSNGALSITGTNSFSGNAAESKGGAIYNDGSGTITFTGTSTFSGNTANGVANDIHNLGTINFAEGSTTYLAGGISGDNTGKLTGNGSLVITDAAATISGQAEIAETLTASATGDVNDALAGDSAKLEAQLNGVKVTRMAEGLISGEVTRNADGTFTKKTSTILKDTLEQATVAPLAVNRILMNDVRKRMGDLRDASGEAGVWMRWDGGKLAGDEGLTNNFNTIQIGGDMLTGIQNVRAGVAASFTHGDVDHNNGDGEMEAYTFAAYGTWMADNGMFADVIARVGFTNSELNVKGGTADMDNEALSLSAEYGWRLPVCDQFFVEPQVELTYTYVTGADFTIKTAQYDVDSVDSLLGRAGLAAGWKLPNDRGNIYARASVVHEFLGDSKISATNKGGYAAYELDGEDTWLEYGIGANVKLTDSTYIWADVERTEGAEIDEEWRGTVGVRFSF